MKILAFYLPQYHRTKENDEWWGDGFTEWTNVKKAKPWVKDQIQPKIPLNNNYYNLMDKSTVEWQTSLMKEYGVYGFCYYHYWFTGKMLLEKPAENLLKWKDIEQPFCFAWANCTWARTWSAVKSQTNWVENDKRTEGKGILVEQKYGDRSDWVSHYKYLSQFFKDNRYIKENGKPIFLVYHVNDISCAKEMFALWNELAVKDGLPGIHIVSMNEQPHNNPYVNAIAMYGNYGRYDFHLIRAKFNALIYKLKLPLKPLKNILSYKKVWENMIAEQPFPNIDTYPGAVVMYDETPRRGSKGTYIKGASPMLFKKYLKQQIEKAKNVCKTDYIFVDAWNEWGEGNYLEPDVENGYGYLEALRDAIKEEME